MTSASPCVCPRPPLDATAHTRPAQVTLAFAPRPEGGDLRTWARTSIYGEEVEIPQRVLGTAGKMRLALRKPETWRLTTDTDVDVSNFAPSEADGVVSYDVDALVIQGKTSRKRFAASVGNRPTVLIDQVLPGELAGTENR